MKNLFHDSLKEMKRLGARLVEIEQIRHEMRKGKAPKEAFQQLDRRHRAELAYGKAVRRNLTLGIFMVFILVAMGMVNGVAALANR